MTLVRELRSLDREAWLFLSVDNEKTDRLVNAVHCDPSWIIREREWPDFAAQISGAGKSWECVILDRYQTPSETFSRWVKVAPLIGIDEGGPCRNSFDFLIDILPGAAAVNKWRAANISDPSLLPLPEKTEHPESRTNTAALKILVSFGQEDSAGLGLAVTNALTRAMHTANNSSNCLDITLPEKPIPNLSEHLGEYGIVITHYGLTAFEALYAGVPVLLLSPGAYHEKLARAAGFYSAGIGVKKAAKLARLLFQKNALNQLNHALLRKLENHCAALAARYNLDRKPAQSLASLINGFTPLVSRKCPACGALLHDEIFARYGERSYCRCPECGIISMNRVNQPPIEYAREYFFDMYKRQYGKTYLEDFPNLINMAKQRLAIIQQLLPPAADAAGETCLLDIGCAYGPFLAAAQTAGFSPFGIDPAEDAVQYVRQTLGIPAAQGFFPFPDATLQPHSYNVVTLWYVIEHFRDCIPALEEIRRLLKPGGVLAFATPSFAGISGRASLTRFLEHSPADHWTIWSPATCRRALKKAGFTVKKIAVSGIHPERFPVIGRFARSRKSPLYGLLLAFSKMFALGDTFEVYAVLS
jgi:2-polyprenyl-3-methyl-5-hydroxy-6-metoxy-1,4-benzoquinol methylase/spore coat polysaccharide biosynthesis predicted glycosyltransferase SpsG